MTAALKDAYALISAYKAGQLAPGSPITAEQGELLARLADDLAVDGPRNDPEALVLPIAQADSHWHRQAADIVIAFHDLKEAGALDEAEARRSEFMRLCPSTWYRGVVSGL